MNPCINPDQQRIGTPSPLEVSYDRREGKVVVPIESQITSSISSCGKVMAKPRQFTSEYIVYDSQDGVLLIDGDKAPDGLTEELVFESYVQAYPNL